MLTLQNTDNQYLLRCVRLSNPAISTTCTSNAAMNWCCADGVPATFGRGCTNFRSSKLPNLWNIRCWPRCRSFALSSKMPGRYALPGPSRCPCISFRTGRSTLFSTGSSWSAGRPPCAKCSLFRVKSSAITPFPVLRSVIYPADSSFVRLRHTVCRLIDVKPNEENEINYVYRCTIHALHPGEPGAGRLSDRCAGVFAG